MGRPYLQYVGDRSARYCCRSCNCDVASSSALLWEGIMGSRQPAVLLRETVNVERCGEERRERLSTGRYTLVDISCRGCYKKLGWHYLCAATPDQKYKEGCSLIEVASLHIMPARPQEPEAPAVQHRVAVQC
ncbi:g8585 [Coccomyxa viridis]|uniref:Protein yippee-like n=1 Tax=Coccomyxa viridis TaxID=1274662 RepID=A0ABP1G7F9_9CHLO